MNLISTESLNQAIVVIGMPDTIVIDHLRGSDALREQPVD